MENMDYLLSCLRPQNLLLTSILCASAVFILVLVMEILHLRRVRKTAYLMAGPKGHVPFAFYLYTLLRIAAFTLLTWSAVVLVANIGMFEPKAGGDATTLTRKNIHHVVFMLDASPSMIIPNDAGPEHKQERYKRAEEVYRSLVKRIRPDQCRFTVIVYWHQAKVAVLDTPDLNIVDNFFKNTTTMAYALWDQDPAASETAVDKALDLAQKVGEPWAQQSATLIVMTDGDILPEKGLAKLPESYKRTLVLGFGDTAKGAMVNNHYSKQNDGALVDMASRYGGDYFNANELLPGSALLAEIKTADTHENLFTMSLRILARWGFILSGCVLACSPLLAGLFAARWQRNAGSKPVKEVNV